MKKLYMSLLLAVPMMSSAQSTPSTSEAFHALHDFKTENREFGDTITFDELTSGTVVNDQYAFTHGAKFSGWPSGYFCDTYDYGPDTYGSIAKSSSWYDGVRIDFVNPEDTTEVIPVCTFGFNNPIDTEIDYIVVNFYDINDNLLFTHHSVSPELVNIELGPVGAAYVTLDDENGSAYVFDDVWFTASCPASVETQDNAAFEVYPNPTSDELTVQPNQNWISSIGLYDVSGKMIQSIAVNSNQSFKIQLGHIPAGIYLLRDDKNFISKVITKI